LTSMTWLACRLRPGTLTAMVRLPGDVSCSVCLASPIWVRVLG
jgi:hypothetical protein